MKEPTLFPLESSTRNATPFLLPVANDAEELLLSANLYLEYEEITVSPLFSSIKYAAPFQVILIFAVVDFPVPIKPIS